MLHSLLQLCISWTRKITCENHPIDVHIERSESICDLLLLSNILCMCRFCC